MERPFSRGSHVLTLRRNRMSAVSFVVFLYYRSQRKDLVYVLLIRMGICADMWACERLNVKLLTCN